MLRRTTVALMLSALALAVAPAATGAPPADNRAAPDDDVPRTEPAVAISPRDPHLVVTVAKHEPDLTVQVSRDGGRSFPTSQVLPLVAGAQRNSDPAADFDATGRLYVSSVAYSVKDAALDLTRGGLAVVRSDDGGRTWQAPVLAVRNTTDDSGCRFADYSSIAVDRRTATVHVAWQALEYAAGDCTSLQRIALYTARSHDGGRTWSEPLELPAPPDGLPYVPVLHVGGRGEVAVVFTMTDYEPTDTDCRHGGLSNSYGIVVSRDGGRTFRYTLVHESTCGSVSSLVQSPAYGAHLASSTGATYRLPQGTDVAADPVTGTLVQVTMGVDPAKAFNRLQVWRSTDGGRTFFPGGAPAAAPSEQQIFPRLSAGPDGRFTLLWLAQGPGGSYVATAATSRDTGRTWSAPEAVATQVSQVRHPYYSGFIGDYIANETGPDGTAHLVWTDTRAADHGLAYGGFFPQIWTARH
jgi:hypothetical protein